MDSDLDWVLENDNGTYSELSPSEEIDGDVDTDPGFQTDCDSVLRTSRIYDALYEQDIYVPEVALQRRSARTPPVTRSPARRTSSSRSIRRTAPGPSASKRNDPLYHSGEADLQYFSGYIFKNTIMKNMFNMTCQKFLDGENISSKD